jgi:hypothetical protein
VDTRQFIASLVGSLAWPMAIVILVVVLRHRLADLFEQLPKRVKAGPLELEWDRTVAETATELAAPRAASPAAPVYVDDLADLVPLADTHPGAAVLDAAARVEQALATRFEAAGADVPPSRGMRDLARRAVAQGLISEETARAIDGLTILRNLAAHGRDGVTPDRAREFLTLAEAVLYQLGSPSS